MLPIQTSGSAHPRYDNQIIIDLIEWPRDSKGSLFTEAQLNTNLGEGFNSSIISPDLKGIQFKGAKSYELTHHLLPLIIDRKNHLMIPAVAQEILRTVTARTRIYINGHCERGSPIIATCEDYNDYQWVSAENLAQILYFHILPYYHPAIDSPEKLKISLLSCEAGVATGNSELPGVSDNSFAACFSYYLERGLLPCSVVARTGKVVMNNHTGAGFLDQGRTINPIRANVLRPERIRDYEKLLRKMNTILAELNELNERDKDARNRDPREQEMINNNKTQLTIKYNHYKKALLSCYVDPRTPGIKVQYQWCGPLQHKEIVKYQENTPLIRLRHDALAIIENCINRTSNFEKKRGLFWLYFVIKGMPTEAGIRAEIQTALTQNAGEGYNVNTRSRTKFLKREKVGHSYAYQRLFNLINR